MDKKFLSMTVGVGKDTIDHFKIAVDKLKICPPSVVLKFNKTHEETEPLDKIHGELAFRMYPYIKDSYIKTVGLIEMARSYVRRSDVGRRLPKADDLSGLTDLEETALDVCRAVEEIQRGERTPGQHLLMKNAMDAAAHSYRSVSSICGQALRD